MSEAIELIETKGACCETTPRYKVMLNGVQVEEVYYNMKGYVGYLPVPSNTSPKGYDRLSIGEKNITAYRMQVKKLNKEWRKSQ